MSRLKQFTRSLISSYAFLGVNVFYTLASVPLALKYLSEAEFGLWAVTMQMGVYLSMIDLGMGHSIARILIEHKDERGNGRYGAIIKCGFLVGAVQGAIVLLVGLSLVWFMAGWLRVPAGLSGSFFWLMVGQILLTAATFLSRTFGQVLSAWQRMDIFNYTQIAQLVVGFGVLWLGFHLKMGVFSLLAGAAAGWLCSNLACVFACRSLGFWPNFGEWGQVSWEQFREVFSFGTDVFVIILGSQLIVASQIVLISRQLGLEAAALWSVMTKVFTLVTQVVNRIVGNALPAFAEMHVRREHVRLWERYRSLFITVNVFGGFCAILFAACNGPFVTIWTHGKFSWPIINNVLLGIWLIVLTQQGCHNSMIICLREIRGLKYIYLVEGVVFIGFSWVILQRTGIAGMLICSILATLLFTWSNGLWRLARLAKTGWKSLLWDWQLPLLWVLLAIVPCWLIAEWFLGDASNWLRLVVNGGVLAVVGLWVGVRYSLPSNLVAEMIGKLPLPLQRPALLVSSFVCRQSRA